ncbi:MAG: flavin reductase family protein [Alphaproteobacteria bacterium]|nr:flavin reductase family protein [Alphaproteobacteria bacterium]MCB9974594.1 flavin reductase family protein [Rhodospirillales bacterium]
MFYEPRKQDPKADLGLKHNPWKALVQPRPIGWISTMSAEGKVNLAPYSYYNAVCEDPPIIMFSSSSRTKDTSRNILETGEFVVNVVTEALLHPMVETSRDVPHGVDEFELAGLTKRASRIVQPPGVAESPIHLECTFFKSLDIPSTDPESDYVVIFGEVVGIHIDESIIRDGLVDFVSVGRLGYKEYSLTSNKQSVVLKKRDI